MEHIESLLNSEEENPLYITCFYCRLPVDGYVDGYQRHINYHSKNKDFEGKLVNYCCTFRNCKASYTEFKSLCRHLRNKHPVESCTPSKRRRLSIEPRLPIEPEPCDFLLPDDNFQLPEEVNMLAFEDIKNDEFPHEPPHAIGSLSRFPPLIWRAANLIRNPCAAWHQFGAQRLTHQISRQLCIDWTSSMTTDGAEFSTPASEAECWRTAKFFEDVVRADLNAVASEEIYVVDVQVANANAKVEGYMSLMHRVTVRFQVGRSGTIQMRSYVVKEKSSKVFGGDFVEKLAVFSKEIEVYERFLPAFEEFWKDEAIQFGPRVLKTVSTPYTVIVMEDLKSKGFAMKQRSEGLSLELCEQVLSKVAKFHAASVVFYEQNGPYPDDFKEGVFSEKLKEDMEAYYAPMLESYIHALEDLGFSLEIREALDCYRGKIYSYMCKLFEPDSTKLNVLNHGDLWVNNLQFSETEVLLLDYQIAVFCSPSMDLLYFIINSSALDVRTDKFDHLIEHYYSELAKSLKTLNAKTQIPTLNDIQEDVRQHGFLACLLSMEGLLMMLVPEVELNMELLGSNTDAGTEYRKSFYSYPRVRSMLEKLVPFMWERGFLKMTQ